MGFWDIGGGLGCDNFFFFVLIWRCVFGLLDELFRGGGVFFWGWWFIIFVLIGNGVYEVGCEGNVGCGCDKGVVLLFWGGIYIFWGCIFFRGKWGFEISGGGRVVVLLFGLICIVDFFVEEFGWILGCWIIFLGFVLNICCG